MNGTKFDQLIKTIATQRVSRLTALRGLAAGAVAGLTRLSLSADEAGAADDKKRRVCVCSSCDPASCDTKKKEKKKVKRILRRNACAYKGKCQAGRAGCVCQTPLPPPTTTPTPTTPVPGFSCTSNAECPRFEVCFGTSCGPCTTYTECNANNSEVCINGRCIGTGGPNRIACETTEQCESATGSALFECYDTTTDSDFNNDTCLIDNDCSPAEGGGACPSGRPLCKAGACVTPCVAGACDPGQTCRGGLCIVDEEL